MVGVNVGKCVMTLILHSSVRLCVTLHKRKPHLLKSRVLQQRLSSDSKSVRCLLPLRFHPHPVIQISKG